MSPAFAILSGALGALGAVAIHDIWFSGTNILRNFPILLHLRFLLIEIGPGLRQYIVGENREQAPFNREERQWIEQSADAIQSIRNEILAVTHACGYEHPSQFTAQDIEVSSGPGTFSTLEQIHGYTPSRIWRKVA